MRRTLIGVVAVLVATVAVVPAVSGRTDASPAKAKLASRLMRLDPGARTGANTQVGTAPHARLSGVHGRANFIMGLGHHQRIMGGAGNDQLGAQGAAGARIHGGHGNDLIHGGPGRQHIHGGHGHDYIHGGHGHDVIRGGHGHDRIHGGMGHDFIHGGPGHDRIHGGPGHDRLRGGSGHDRIHGGPGRDRLEGGPGNDALVDRQGATVVVPGAGTNRVDVADSSSDRVVCAVHSVNRIVVDLDDRLDAGCMTQASTVRYRQPSSGAPTVDARAPDPPAGRAALSVSGDGSSGNPYVAECTEPTKTICSTPLFAPHSITGLWVNEYVPAYQCPKSHPYLYDVSYAPAGTTLPHGVGVLGLGPIGMSIAGFKTTKVTVNGITSGYTTGTDTGFPNSSATNWTTGTNSYQIQLHCTSDTYYAVFLGYS